MRIYASKAHNTTPHSSFRGPTPDELYRGTADKVVADLAEADGGVAVAPEQVGHGEWLLRFLFPFPVLGPDVPALGAAAGEHRAARWSAGGGVNVVAGEHPAFAGQAIDVRRADVLHTVTAGFAAQVVDADQEHVGPGGGFGCEAEVRRGGKCQGDHREMDAGHRWIMHPYVRSEAEVARIASAEVAFRGPT